jgi:L-lysine exporter family protein LysE/ArgO
MDIIAPIWKGLITGILFTLTFGTVFFSLIQTSIKRGLKQALFIAFGVLLSDAFFISAAVLGTTFIADEMLKYDAEIRLVGFIFLLILGIRSIVKVEVDHTDDAAPTETKNALYAMKGIMLNSINPMILISWMGVTTYVESVAKFNFNQVILFYSIVLATMFSTMFSISYFAGKLRTVLSAKNMHRLNIGSGILFIIFALVILWPIIEPFLLGS